MHTRAGPAWMALIGGLLGAALLGCDKTAGIELQPGAATTLRLESFKDAYFPETYELTFSRCAAWTDRSGDIHILAQSLSDLAPVTSGERRGGWKSLRNRMNWPGSAPSGAAASVNSTGDIGDGGALIASDAAAAQSAATAPAKLASPGAIEQFLHIHVYWRPQPGTTPADASLQDARLRYVMTTPEGPRVYDGSGFVAMRRASGERLALAIERAELSCAAPAAASTDRLGTIRLSGTLLARRDSAAAVDALREVEQRTGEVAVSQP